MPKKKGLEQARSDRLAAKSPSTQANEFVREKIEVGKKVLVMGGDGFCGWPTTLYLSDQGTSSGYCR